MKKYHILMLGSLAAAFTACEEAPADAPMQVNPQGPVLAADAVQITPDALLTDGETLNLDSYIDEAVIPVFSLAADNLPAGSKISAEMQISADQDFAEYQTIALALEGTSFTVEPAAMHEAYLETFGDETSAQTAYYRVPVSFTTENGTSYRLGAADYYAASGSFSETPMVSIMPTDFVYTPGGSNNWSQIASNYLYPANDPVEGCYYGVVNNNGGFKVTVLPDWNGTNYGDGGPGILSTDGGAGNIQAENGLNWVSVNLVDLTCNIVKIESVGIMGAGNGWADDQFLAPDETGMVYSGQVVLDGEWKVRFNSNWDYNYGGRPIMPVYNGGNFSSPAGNYMVTVDFNGHHPKIKARKI